MIAENLLYGVLPPSVVEWNTRELSARLKMPVDGMQKSILRITEAMEKTAKCRYAAIRLPVTAENERVKFGDLEITSHALSKNLAGCPTAFLFAITLGAETDRYIRTESARSAADGFMADAVASAYAEAAMNAAEKILAANAPHKPRFSAGYGDLSVEIQPQLLMLLQADRTLGTVALASCLMSPSKSITAFMGMTEDV